MTFSLHDSVITSPTNVFPTFSPIHFSEDSTPDIATLSDGNLVATVSASTCAFSNFQIPKTGKWFVEVLLATNSSPQFGIGKVNAVGQGASTGYYGIYNNGSSLILHNGSHTVPTSSGSWSPHGTNHVGLIAIDSDNNKIWLGVNTNVSAGASSGLYIGNSTSAAFDANYPTIGTNGYNTAFDINDGWFINVSGGGASVWVLNCGQDPTFGGRRSGVNPSSGDGSIGLFHTVPPTGFKALCTANIQSSLAIDPNVDDVPEDFFKCVKYTVPTVAANAAGPTYTVDVGFNADLHWIKCTNAAEQHYLVDTVRSTTTTYDDFLNSNSTEDEDGANDNVTNATLTKVSNGFQVSTTNASAGELYYTNRTYISWNWKAGGVPSGATSADTSAKRILTNGTRDDTSCDALRNAAASVGSNHIITPTLMSINQQAGFSIVQYYGGNTSNGHTNANSALGMQGIPHGLGKYAKFVLIKSLDTSSGWVAFVPHPLYGLGHNYHLRLDTTAAGSGNNWTGDNRQGISYLPDTDNVIYVGNDNMVSKQGDKFIMYVFTDIEGYSEFGSYTGNGSATSGPFIACGFKPAWVLVKRITDGTNSWEIRDNARDTFNSADNRLFPDSSAVEDADNEGIDFLSNGFRIMNSGGGCNTSGKTYIFAAFAEMPQKYAVAR